MIEQLMEISQKFTNMTWRYSMRVLKQSSARGLLVRIFLEFYKEFCFVQI